MNEPSMDNEERKVKKENTLQVFKLADKKQSIYLDPNRVLYFTPMPDNTTSIHYKGHSFRVDAHSGIVAKYLEPVPIPIPTVNRHNPDGRSNRKRED